MLPSKSSLILLRVRKDSSLFHHFPTDASFTLFLSLCTTCLTNFVEISQSSRLQRVPPRPPLPWRYLCVACVRPPRCHVAAVLWPVLCLPSLPQCTPGCPRSPRRSSTASSVTPSSAKKSEDVSKRPKEQIRVVVIFFLQFVGVLSLHLTLRHKGLIAAWSQSWGSGGAHEGRCHQRLLCSVFLSLAVMDDKNVAKLNELIQQGWVASSCYE